MKPLLNRQYLFSALLVVAVVPALAAHQEVLLKRRAKVGDAAEFKINAEFDTPNGVIKLTQVQNQKLVVVRADGSYELESENTNSVVVAPGLKGPQTVKQPDEKSSSEHLANGRTKSITSVPAAGPASYRLAHLREFEAPSTPVQIGQEIKYTVPADASIGSPAMEATYKVVALETVKGWSTAKLTFTATETDGEVKASITGTTWINTADGSSVKTDALWKNIQLPGVPIPLDGKFLLERVK